MTVHGLVAFQNEQDVWLRRIAVSSLGERGCCIRMPLGGKQRLSVNESDMNTQRSARKAHTVMERAMEEQGVVEGRGGDGSYYLYIHCDLDSYVMGNRSQ